MATPEPTAAATISVCGLPIWNPSAAEFSTWFWDSCARHDRTTRLAIVNAHTVNLASSDTGYAGVLAGFEARINDGAGMALAARLRGSRFFENLNGTDLFPALLAQAPQGTRVFLFGAAEVSNAGAAEAIAKRFPGVRVAGRLPGFGVEHADAAAAIASSNADLVLVALGQPLQERFIHEYATQWNAGVACGVGAFFDFLSGTVPRAPRLVRRARCEWAFRLAIEPRRMWRRYLAGNVVFCFRAARSRTSDLVAASRAHGGSTGTPRPAATFDRPDGPASSR